MPNVNRYSEFEFAKGWASVSQICGMLEKPFLYQWYARLGAEANRINAASKKIGNLIDNEISIFFKDPVSRIADRTVLDIKENRELYEQSLDNFHTVAKAIKPISVFGQQTVYSKLNKYIGTYDRLMIVEDRLVLSDWKATNYLDYSYTMQLEAYYRALKEMIDTFVPVAKLPKQYENIEWHEKPLWLVQFPKKEKVDLETNIIKFAPSDLRFSNFKNLLSFHYGKKQDEQELKLIDYKPKGDKNNAKRQTSRVSSSRSRTRKSR